jgi:hypothetical protein
MSERENPMRYIEAAIQEHVLPVASELKAIQKRLRELRESLPPVSGRDEEEMDAVTELRSVIDCVLLDSLGPAARDLETVAAYLSKGRKPDASDEARLG